MSHIILSSHILLKNTQTLALSLAQAENFIAAHTNEKNFVRPTDYAARDPDPLFMTRLWYTLLGCSFFSMISFLAPLFYIPHEDAYPFQKRFRFFTITGTLGALLYVVSAIGLSEESRQCMGDLCVYQALLAFQKATWAVMVSILLPIVTGGGWRPVRQEAMLLWNMLSLNKAYCRNVNSCP